MFEKQCTEMKATVAELMQKLNVLKEKVSDCFFLGLYSTSELTRSSLKPWFLALVAWLLWVRDKFLPQWEQFKSTKLTG